MAKKFNIHEWQQKHLFEQDDFTPDLEKDALQRDKIRQMMDKEKKSLTSNIEQTWESYEIMTDDLIQFIQIQYDANGSDIVDDWDDLIDTLQKKLESFREDKELNENEENIPELSDQEKDNLHDMVIEFARKLTDVRGGNYSGDKLLAALQHVTLEIENLEPMIYDDEDEDGIPDELENDEELDEQNVTGTGASFSAGDGAGYATKLKSSPRWFKKKEKMVEQENEEQPEEEIEQDVEKIEDSPMLDKVNTVEEWEDLVQVVIDMADEIKAVTPAVQKQVLINAVQQLNKPE